MKIYNVNLVNKQPINKSIAKRTNVLPGYSNLKLKPQLQTDVILFKGKESVLTKEQNALNNLKVLLKQNIINRELNDVLMKEVNSKNKNVIKYLNGIRASQESNLKGHKAVAERLVDNHVQISGAIASSIIDDEKKIKLDYDNKIRMIIGISQIYEKNKGVKIKETTGEVGFGGRKDKAKAIIKKHSDLAKVLSTGDRNILIEILPRFETFIFGCNIYGLMTNEEVMAKSIAALYHKPLYKESTYSFKYSPEGEEKVGVIFSTGINELDSILGQTSEEIIKRTAKPALSSSGGYYGPIVDADFVAETTNKLGENILKFYQNETGDYD